jgi:hypothetical protein
MKRTISILLLSFFSPYVTAGVHAYECKIKSELHTNNAGLLISKNKIYLSGVFNVERKTGVVLGGGLGNSSYKTKTVIDPGGKEQSFKLLWESHPVVGISGGINSVYLTVEEFNENYLKPFIVVVGNTVLSGTCK